MIALLKRGSDFLIGQPPLHGGVQLAGLDDRLQVGDGDVLLCDDLVPLGDPVVELVKLGCMAPRIGIAVFQADQQPGPIQAGVISIAKPESVERPD